ncbi:MAG: ABC transporter permease [Oscillospiraceae bacterium]
MAENKTAVLNRKTTTVKKTNQTLVVLKKLSKKKAAMAGLIVFMFFVLIAILAKWIAPYDYTAMDPTNAFASPSVAHPFGCDKYGRDILSRMMIGAGYSLSIGVLGVILSNILGMFFGAIAGFFGQKADNIVMRIMDIIQSIPGILLSMIVSTVLGPGYFNTVLALSVGAIPNTSRMLRSCILSIRNQEYVEAAESINCSKARIIVKHILPNCFSPLLVGATMGIGGTIGQAASLSFIGLGIQPPMAEWGAMLSDGRNYITTHPHMLLFPGLAIALVTFSLNMLGDGLRDVVDPKLKK